MKKLEEWIIKINDEDHFKEVIRVLDDFGYNTEFCCWWYNRSMYGVNFIYCHKNVCFTCMGNDYAYNPYTLEEFVKAHNNFKNMKFSINSKEDYTKLLNHLFNLGYFKVFYGEKCNRNVKDGYLGKYIYTSDSGLVYGVLTNNEKEYYENNENPEYTLEELITYELKEVVKVHCKNCGKEINTNMKNHFKFNNGSYLCWDCFKEVEHACFPF